MRSRRQIRTHRIEFDVSKVPPCAAPGPTTADACLRWLVSLLAHVYEEATGADLALEVNNFTGVDLPRGTVSRATDQAAEGCVAFPAGPSEPDAGR